MIWTRKPKPANALGLADASAKMMSAIITGKGKGMAWIDFLAADMAAEVGKLESENDNEAATPERSLK